MPRNTDRPKEYRQMISFAQGELKKKLGNHPPVSVTKEEYITGMDAYPADVKAVVQEVSDEVLQGKKYELSYNQLSSALVGALKELELLQVS